MAKMLQTSERQRHAERASADRNQQASRSQLANHRDRPPHSGAHRHLFLVARRPCDKQQVETFARRSTTTAHRSRNIIQRLFTNTAGKDLF